jgi:hypothetical protein
MRLQTSRIYFLGGLIAGSLFLSNVALTKAAIIASEDFDGYTNFPDMPSDPSNLGVPLVIEGADSPLWMGARIDVGDNDPIANDLAVQQSGGPGSGNLTPVGRAGDQAALVWRLDLTNYENVTLDFDWRTVNADPVDRFVAAYYVGDGLGTPNGTYDWFNDPTKGNGSITWYQNNFTELLRAPRDNVFKPASFGLPGGDVLYLAFWLDNRNTSPSEFEYAKIDNLVVDGEQIPEPGSMLLLALGAACFVSRRTRRAR